MIASPEKALSRKFSRVCGLVSILMPTFFQNSPISCRASASSVSSLECSTTMVAGRPSGSRRMPSEPRLFRPTSSRSLFASFGSYCRPLGRVLGLEQLRALHDRVVGGFGQAQVDDLVELVTVDRQRQRAAEADVAHQLAPFLVARRQVGIEGDLRARAGLPQVDVDARCLGALLQEGVVAHVEIARLQVGLAEAGLGGDQVGRRLRS